VAAAVDAVGIAFVCGSWALFAEDSLRKNK
jgi:hypothetical protein